MPKPRCRSGCLTCRIRRVKCDEKYPACVRCISTGRKCDGYEAPRTYQQNNAKDLRLYIAAERGEQVLHFSPGSVYSPAEQRSLQYFAERTSAALTGYFDSSFWTNTILKVGYTQPAVMHAIVALSSLHEGIEVGGEIRPGNEKNYHQRRLAIQEYDKAIAIMLPRMATPESWSSEESLIACLMFVIIEIAQTNYNIAVEQIKIGFRNINLLATRTATKGFLALDSNIYRLFARAFVQCMFLGEPMLHDFLPLAPIRFSNLPFSNLPDIRDSLDTLYLNLYPILFALGRQGASLETQLPSISHLTTQLETWNTKFTAFLTDNERKLTEKQRIATTLLTMHSTILSILLSVTPSPSSTLCPPSSSTPAFETVISLAKSLLSGPKPLPNFTFDHGLIAPLFYTVLKCPLRLLRLHAVELLHNPHLPTREGMWCARMTSRMAVGILKVSDEMGQHADVAGSRISLDMEKNRMHEAVEDVQGLESEIARQKVAFYYDKDVGDEREIRLMVGSKYAGPYLKEVVVSW